MDGLLFLKLLSAALLLVGLSFGAGAQAQDNDDGENLKALQSQFRTDVSEVSSSADVVTVVPASSENRLWPETMREATILLRVADGWHLNAHEPLQEFLIGTEITVEPRVGLRVSEIHYPEPEHIEFGFAVEELAVYQGDVPVRLSVEASQDAEPGSHTLRGEARVQACNDEVCLRPSTIPVEVPVTIRSGGK